MRSQLINLQRLYLVTLRRFHNFVRQVVDHLVVFFSEFLLLGHELLVNGQQSFGMASGKDWFLSVASAGFGTVRDARQRFCACGFS